MVKKTKKIPYIEQSLKVRYKKNIKKAKSLLDDRQYSMAMVRAITAFDVYITGLLETKMNKEFGETPSKLILKRYKRFPDKKGLMKEVYGLDISKGDFIKNSRKLDNDIKKRNQIAHKGVFAYKSSAIDAIKNVEELVNKIEKRIKV